MRACVCSRRHAPPQRSAATAARPPPRSLRLPTHLDLAVGGAQAGKLALGRVRRELRREGAPVNRARLPGAVHARGAGPFCGVVRGEVVWEGAGGGMRRARCVRGERSGGWGGGTTGGAWFLSRRPRAVVTTGHGAGRARGSEGGAVCGRHCTFDPAATTPRPRRPVPWRSVALQQRGDGQTYPWYRPRRRVRGSSSSSWCGLPAQLGDLADEDGLEICWLISAIFDF